MKVRALFLSDLHLGTRHADAHSLLSYLQKVNPESIYLVGDIVDLWEMKGRDDLLPAHRRVLRAFCEYARQGTNVVFIPGNHDEAFRQHTDRQVMGIPIKRDVIHQTADDRKFLVLHGDEFDSVIKNAHTLSEIGSHLYGLLLTVNRWQNTVRDWVGLEHWSLSNALKQLSKNAMKYIADYEAQVVRRAVSNNVDGVICGHIHKAEARTAQHQDQEVAYYNCGDWVESNTALVETMSGDLELVSPPRVRPRQRATIEQLPLPGLSTQRG